jgi:hypothetical protein
MRTAAPPSVATEAAAPRARALVSLLVGTASALACGQSTVTIPGNPPGTSNTVGDPCANITCSGHGTCAARNGLAACTCETGFVALGLACVAEGDVSMSYSADASGLNGFDLLDRIAWRDAKGLERVAWFARLHTHSIFPNIAGYMTRLSWQPDEGVSPIVCGEDPAGIDASNSQGWGINVMHMHWSQTGGFNPYTGETQIAATTTKRDGFDFVQEPILLGPNHIIYRVTYKQYTTLMPGTPDAPGVDDRKSVDVTTDWVFFSGLDEILYAFTIDTTREFVNDEDPFRSDTRAPYCLFSSQPWADVWDWSGTSGAPSGQGWGDSKKFVTNDMQAWTYGDPNLVPYVWEWVNDGGDAESGFVQTQTYTQKQAGAGFNDGNDATGTTLPGLGDGVDGYAFQMNYYEGYQDKKITWGMPFGAIDGGYGSSTGYQSYTVAMHIGKASDLGVPRLIAETEAIHDGSLSVTAEIGRLATSGPEGSGNPTSFTYSPPGFNHVYRTWEAIAEGGQVQLRFALGAGSYRSPVFVLWELSVADAQKLSARLNGVELNQGSQYLVSLDAAAGRVFVTVLGALVGDNQISFAVSPG